MPVITQEQALGLLAAEVRKFDTDELLEVYNEVFRKDQLTEQEANEDPQALVARLVDHIYSGLEMDVVAALWRLIFIRHRNVWYNEEDERIYYDEEADTVSTE